jgi:hypothetical protein
MHDGLLRVSLEDFQGGARALINGGFFTSSDVRTANAMLCQRGREKWQVQRKRKGRTLAQSSIDRRAPSRFEEFCKAYPAGAAPILTSRPSEIQRPGEKRP